MTALGSPGSQYVGRVGALAVALGVAAAMASTPVAFADRQGADGSAGSSGASATDTSQSGGPARMPRRISTPTVVYPKGYQVTVTGGHVVSAPNANQLVIASDVGSDSVCVVVKPA